jgi:hypothetical protein
LGLVGERLFFGERLLDLDLSILFSGKK